MKCFIIAMANEAEPVLLSMKKKKDYIACDKRVVVGKIAEEPAAVVICGVGKANAASGTQYAIDCLGATTIINVGFAGGLTNDILLTGVYAASAVVQYDFDLTQLNHTPIGTLDECRENFLPLSLPVKGFDVCKVATGDRFNDDLKDLELIRGLLGANVRDMELGAIAQVCMHAKVRCYSFKFISDLAGKGSTTEQFKENIRQCMRKIDINLLKIMKATL